MAKQKKYKLKTHKATAKRFKVTGTGKIIRKELRGRNSAHRRNKSQAARKRMPESYVITAPGTVKKIKRLLHI